MAYSLHYGYPSSSVKGKAMENLITNPIVGMLAMLRDVLTVGCCIAIPVVIGILLICERKAKRF